MFQPKSPESIDAAHAAQSAPADPATDAHDTAQDEDEATEHQHVDPETGDEHEDAEDAETTEDDAAQDGPAGDEWVVPGKFRTTEDVLQAYQHSEQQLGRVHRELAELRRQGTQQQVDSKEQEVADAERNRALLRDFVRDPQGTLQREAQRVQQEQQQQFTQRATLVHGAMAHMAARHTDFTELQGRVSQFISTRPTMQRLLHQLQADPNATQEDFADLLDTAYNAVRAQTANDALQAARDQGRQEAQASTTARKRATGTKQRAKRGNEPGESYEERHRRELREAGPPSRMFG